MSDNNISLEAIYHATAKGASNATDIAVGSGKADSIAVKWSAQQVAMGNLSLVSFPAGETWFVNWLLQEPRDCKRMAEIIHEPDSEDQWRCIWSPRHNGMPNYQRCIEIATTVEALRSSSPAPLADTPEQASASLLKLASQLGGDLGWARIATPNSSKPMEYLATLEKSISRDPFLQAQVQRAWLNAGKPMPMASTEPSVPNR